MILQVTAGFPGQVGVSPGIVPILTSATIDQLTAPGFLNNETLGPNVISPTDVMLVRYNYDPITGISDFGIFLPTFTGGVITLSEDISEGNVVLPVTVGNIAVFADTDGKIKQNINGTAVNLGPITAGSVAGVAGGFTSYPTAPASGSLSFAATNNGGNFNIGITNAVFSQSTAFTIPDPLRATSQFCVTTKNLTSGFLLVADVVTGQVTDLGAKLIANQTAVWGGGGTTNTFSVAGITSSSRVAVQIIGQTGNAAITTVVPGPNNITVSFTADPGGGTVLSYIALSGNVT